VSPFSVPGFFRLTFRGFQSKIKIKRKMMAVRPFQKSKQTHFKKIEGKEGKQK